MLKGRQAFKIGFIGVAALALLQACGSADQAPDLPDNVPDIVVPSAPEIIPTSGQFTEAEEAFYLKRYDTLVEAFRTGADTTAYDTEITFGDNLTPKRLPRGEAQTIPAETVDALIDYAREATSDSFLIYENGKVVSETYFRDITSASLINSKSLAKPLGVVAVGRALKAGYIDSLDQSVADFIVEWKGTDKADIKVRHLLDMRTGLQRQGAAPGPEHILNRSYLHPKHIEVILHEYPLTHVPGERYDYSNANSELVALLIERATGLAYPDWLASQVFEPLGMAGGKIWLNREGGMAHSGCCAGLESESYLKLAVLILQEGEWEGQTFLPSEFITEMTTPTAQYKHAAMGVYLGREYSEFRGAANPDVGNFGATQHSEPYIDKDIMLFDGNGNQVAYMLPSRDIVIIRLGSTPKNGFKWDNAYVPNLVARAVDN